MVCQGKILVCEVFGRNSGALLIDTSTWNGLKRIHPPYRCECLSEDGKFALSRPYNFSNSNNLVLWSVEKDEKVRDFPPSYLQCFSPDSKSFASVQPDHTILIYSLETVEAIQKFMKCVLAQMVNS